MPRARIISPLADVARLVLTELVARLAPLDRLKLHHLEDGRRQALERLCHPGFPRDRHEADVFLHRIHDAIGDQIR